MLRFSQKKIYVLTISKINLNALIKCMNKSSTTAITFKKKHSKAQEVEKLICLLDFISITMLWARAVFHVCTFQFQKHQSYVSNTVDKKNALHMHTHNNRHRLNETDVQTSKLDLISYHTSISIHLNIFLSFFIYLLQHTERIFFRLLCYLRTRCFFVFLSLICVLLLNTESEKMAL